MPSKLACDDCSEALLRAASIRATNERSSARSDPKCGSLRVRIPKNVMLGAAVVLIGLKLIITISPTQSVATCPVRAHVSSACARFPVVDVRICAQFAPSVCACCSAWQQFACGAPIHP